MEVDSAPSGTKRKAEGEHEAQKPARRIRVGYNNMPFPDFFGGCTKKI
jgi:hypothetical protein